MASLHGTGWTDERIERLKKLVIAGFSASEIAQALGGGISRNAVVGKCFRDGLQLGGHPASSPAAASQASTRGGAQRATPPREPKPPRPRAALRPPREPKPAPIPRLEVVTRDGEPLAGKPPIDLTKLRTVQAPSRWLRLADIGPKMCHYIEGDPGPGRMDEALMCAADSGEETYCPAHTKLCGAPPKKPPNITPTADRRRFNGRQFAGAARARTFAE